MIESNLQVRNPPLDLNTPWAPTDPKRIEYAMRRDTAAPHFEQMPFRGMRLFEVDCIVRNANSIFMF